MPSTTNFNWTTPADTDLVKDGAAAIRTLGNNIDASLVDLKGGTTGQVLAKASNTDLDFSWVAQDDSNAIQNALLTTTGDTIYASAASTPARLGIGTTGQVLTVSGGVPVWATPAGGGKVLQVVTATTSTATTISTSTYTDTGLTASITPSANTSKILILASQQLYLSRNTSGANSVYAKGRILRGATAIYSNEYVGGMGLPNMTGNIETFVFWSPVYLDSPSTTSSTTYKLQSGTNAAGSIEAQSFSNSTSSIVLLEIGA